MLYEIYFIKSFNLCTFKNKNRSQSTCEPQDRQPTQDFDLDTIVEEPLESPSTSQSQSVTKRSRSEPPEVTVNIDDEEDVNEILEQSDSEIEDETVVPHSSLSNPDIKGKEKDVVMKCKKRTKKLILAEKLEQKSPSKQVKAEHSNLMKLGKLKIPAAKPKNGETPTVPKTADQPEKDKLTYLLYRKLKHQPKLRIEGTWNHLYGGLAGACCFMKTGAPRNLSLFSGKGSKLRKFLN